MVINTKLKLILNIRMEIFIYIISFKSLPVNIESLYVERWMRKILLKQLSLVYHSFLKWTVSGL